MPYQVSRTDTGQFVLTDPTTDTVVIDDDLAQGFAKLEQVVAGKPALAPAPPSGASQGPSIFEFRGGPRYTPILLAIVLPFAWLAVMYFALANLLSETAIDSRSSNDTEAKLEQLERELKSLRSEVSGAPRTPKTKPKRPKDAKQSGKIEDPEAPEQEPSEQPPPEPAAASPTASAGPS
ncbi:MAG TPA: hypothetical protein VM869_21005 [Enhygromyxa sp.]|nr:hypothetical protein [Enhygromyxa sp.]